MPPDRCLVCHHEKLLPLHEILLRCDQCGFVTARLDDQIDPSALYDDSYFAGQEYRDYQADEALIKRNFKKRLKHICRYQADGRLLELGSAYGFFLDVARSHFDVIGYEVNETAAAHARDQLGLDVRHDDFLTTSAAELSQFDVVTLWDVIEHLERPDLVLEHVSRMTRPGGYLFLTTGDIGSMVARMRGRRWRMIHPPTHLHYFDRSTIARLLEQYGFSVVQINSVGVARSIRQILYSIVALNARCPGLYRSCERFIPASAQVTLNLFDIMMVTARKDDGTAPAT